MPIGSVEGLLGTLLFVVPGGLGIALRRAIFAAHRFTSASPSRLRPDCHRSAESQQRLQSLQCTTRHAQATCTCCLTDRAGVV